MEGSESCPLTTLSQLLMKGWAQSCQLSEGEAQKASNGSGEGNHSRGQGFLLQAQFAEVTIGLDAEPEARRLAEEFPESDGHFGGNGPAAEHNLIDRPRRDPKSARQRVLRQTQRIEVFLEENFAGRDGLHGEYPMALERFSLTILE